jgi:transglutaminase-like putative cysteine protease
VARPIAVEDELLEAVGTDGPAPVSDVVSAEGSRSHVVTAVPGRLTVTYRAAAVVGLQPASMPSAQERLVALRQSRYCPSDLAEALVATELGQLRGRPDAAAQVAEWVHGRVEYVLGSSRPSDTALETLLTGQGVCRDFAHLTVMCCRSLGVPARFVAVYAPGLSPMDFHAVAEVAGPDGWEVVDATRLAPRQSLVRIATGRDAADTALVATVQGHADLIETSVRAVVDGDLPADDHRSVVSIP